MKQLALQFVEHVRVAQKAANDRKFKRFAAVSAPCSTRVEVLIDEILAADRMRLLEPTSLPKILRGRVPARRPQTAIISYAAQAAIARRLRMENIDVVAAVNQAVRRRDARLDRLARKLGCS